MAKDKGANTPVGGAQGPVNEGTSEPQKVVDFEDEQAANDQQQADEADAARRVSTRRDAPTAEQEIAMRSGDVHAAESDKFVRVFSVGTNAKQLAGVSHEANASSLVQDAINNGLRIVGDVTFDGAEPDPASPDDRAFLTYSAPAMPAHMLSPEQAVLSPGFKSTGE